jgi:hypothetical protein
MDQESRKHLRLPVDAITFIELESSFAGSPEPAIMATVITQEASRKGLQIILKEEVTVGNILQVGIDLPDSVDTLFLVAEVRWCQRNEDPTNPWTAGFEVLNDGDSDILRWAQLVARMEGSE